MTTNTSPIPRNNVAAQMTRRFIQVFIIMGIQGAILFAAAGRLNWTWAWVFLGIYLAAVILNGVVLISKDPELIAERGQVKEDAKPWDKLLAPIVSLFGPVATLIIAGLDARFGWTEAVSLPVHLIGAVVFALGFLMVTWSMASNRFFSGVVCIQADRGHRVASAGPYRLVRHPGYVGMIAFSLATPILLGSWWALIPAGITAGLHVLRTALEDRTLRAELPGYEDYAGRTRYRLLPGIW